MKVLQINNCHYRRGGADVVYLNTIDLLQRHGHDVICFSKTNKNNSSSKYDKYFVDEVKYLEASPLRKALLLPRFIYSGESRKKLEKLLKETKPDVAHVHLYKADLTSSIFITLRKYRIPIMITLHDYGLLCPHNLLLDGKMNICERCINGSSFNCVIHKCNRNNLLLSTVSALEFEFQKRMFPFGKVFDKLVVVSKFGKLIHAKDKKLQPKLEHIYNFSPSLDDIRPNPDKGSYFLFFGRLSKEKGIASLIRAWNLKQRNSTLKIVGTGELSALCSEEASANKGIEVLGFKSGDDLTELIRGASFVVAPSEWYENNPLSVIEAYSHGKPVIGSNVGGIPDIVVDNETGYLFEMKNIEDLDSKISLAEGLSADDYAAMSENARKFADSNFHEKNHYDRLINAYNELIS